MSVNTVVLSARLRIASSQPPLRRVCLPAWGAGVGGVAAVRRTRARVARSEDDGTGPRACEKTTNANKEIGKEEFLPLIPR